MNAKEFFAALGADDSAAVRRFLEKNPSLTQAYTNSGYTVTHFAAETSSTDVLSTLLDFGAPLFGGESERGAMPVHIAAALRDDTSVLQLMLEREPSLLDQEDDLEATLLHYAAGNRRSSAPLALALGATRGGVGCRDCEGMSPLHFAAASDNGNNVRLLLEAGADVDSQDYRQRTPLLEAVSNGSLFSAGALLEWGASTAVEDERGVTPLEEAVMHPTGPLVNMTRLIMEHIGEDGIGLLLRGMGACHSRAADSFHKEECHRVLGTIAGHVVSCLGG